MHHVKCWKIWAREEKDERKAAYSKDGKGYRDCVQGISGPSPLFLSAAEDLSPAAYLARFIHNQVNAEYSILS